MDDFFKNENFVLRKNQQGIEHFFNKVFHEDLFCASLSLSARWFAVRECGFSGLHFIILPDKDSAEYCAADLYQLIEGDKVFILPHSGKNVERSNYKSTLCVQRTAALGKIAEHRSGENLYIVSYPAALEEKIPSLKKNFKPVVSFQKGDEISHEKISSLLYEHGFEKVDFVSQPGQYALRGSIVDIFSYSINQPYRLSFFGNEIDDIKIFDSNTQLSIEKVDKADIYPSFFEGKTMSEEEFVTEHLPKDTLFWLDTSPLYKEAEFYSFIGAYKKIYLSSPPENKMETVKFNISAQPVFHKNFDLMIEDIRSKRENGYRVLIFGEKKTQLERLSSIIRESGGVLPEFVPGKNLHNGFINHDARICCYTDHEIFDRFHRVVMRRTVEKSEQLTINDLTSFNLGDYVVHIDYGVGIFGGLVKLKDDKGRMHDVVKLQYRDNDVVFISIHSLHKISRYKSREGEPPVIHKLGSRTWATTKTNAKKKVKDIAKDLIRLYAQRKGTQGYAFSADSYLQQELESSFMYEDTPDQEKAVKAVKRDMEDDCPMDRLVCGDVGFGKTEVAIRAAFKAVCDSKQVAVLVPTTILCLQHYNTFKSRLENFPCNIEFVSRLRSPKQIAEITRRLQQGQIDIIIGTHKLLGCGFSFKDLGLLIIDEEQKFGVGAKEKLRQLKANIDTLTLTATPIPRTLQFSLLGARDLSIINTPPPNRIPVQTEIIHFDKKEIKGIIDYELNRAGQIFFVHNKVEELDSIRELLHRLIPDMRICVAHGQMESKELENKVLDFIRGDYDLLLCTTIIENGLDIPNANTILINQAQNIGLSDLHQLRGRVGRSNKQAFCYLVVPPLTAISDDSRRRLKAIETFSDLGSGFSIAMQDLDIRGAGNLLGAEQSGFISDMGLETYQKILSEAMEELGVETGFTHTSVKENFVTECMVDTDVSACLPDSYIEIPMEKLRIYKDLDNVEDEKSLERLHDRLADRFGRLPEEVENLFSVIRIRMTGKRIGLEKIIFKNRLLIAYFVSNPMAKYYKSEVFASVLDGVTANADLFELKQTDDGKLKLLSRGVDSLAGVLARLKTLSPPVS